MKWQAKVAIQAVLGRVPGGENVNDRLQLRRGRHSTRDMQRRIDKATGFLCDVALRSELRDKAIVEIGTGWDGLHPILLSCLGASSVTTYDHVRHLREEHCRLVLSELLDHPGLDRLCEIEPRARERCEDLATTDGLDDLLRAARITYVAPGDACATGLEPGSVDIVYSAAVLEHLPESVIDGLLAESRRVLRPGGTFVARVGLHDHYHAMDDSISRVNFLKYPEWVWAPLVKNKISYHNRLREPQYVERFERYGGRVVWRERYVDDVDLQALASMKVNRRFDGFTPEELAAWRADYVVEFGPVIADGASPDGRTVATGEVSDRASVVTSPA